MRKARSLLLLAPPVLVACSGMSLTSAPAPAPQPLLLADAGTQRPAARLTVAMLREAQRRRHEDAKPGEGDFAIDVTPSKGDVFGLGGSVLGDAAAGLPGGAALGFSGQVAGGNKVGKAMGSTLGALLGSVFGPIGGIFGGVAGGYAGKQIHHALADNDASQDDFGPLYIDGMDTGPLLATSLPPPRAVANET
jgi:hypothetical protein